MNTNEYDKKKDSVWDLHTEFTLAIRNKMVRVKQNPEMMRCDDLMKKWTVARMNERKNEIRDEKKSTRELKFENGHLASANF